MPDRRSGTRFAGKDKRHYNRIRATKIQENVMTNMGTVDRTVRLLVGIVLVAYAIPIGFPPTGWNWVGWIGVVPILTALIGFCPAYRLIGLSTCPLQRR
jgi:hypothetical protein